MIGSIIDGVGSAANVARRHLHRGSNRCDWRCSHDRERCIRRVRNNSVGRCHVEIFVRPMQYKGCQQAHHAQVAICALFTTPNSLKLQGRRKAFSPVRKVRAISQRCAHNQARQPSNPIASDARPFPPHAVSSIEGLRTPAPPCAPHHLHGAGIRKPSQKRTCRNQWRMASEPTSQ
jgi:hypothetical protein